MLVHDARSNDSWSNDPQFMQKLCKHARDNSWYQGKKFLGEVAFLQKLSFSIWLFSDENNVTNDIEIIPTDCVNCCSIESKWA